MKAWRRIIPPTLLAVLSLYTLVFDSAPLSVSTEAETTATKLPAAAGDVVVLVTDFQLVRLGALAKASLEYMRDLDQRLFDAEWVRSYSGPMSATVVRAEGNEILVTPFLPADMIESYREPRVIELAGQYERFPELAPYYSAGFTACAFYVEPGITVSAQDLVRKLDRLRDDIGAEHGISFSYTGVRPVRASIEQYLTRDALRVIPTAFLLVSAVYLLAFGDWRFVCLSWLVKFLATAAAYAIYQIFFDIVSPLIILVPIFSFGLLSDYLIHVLYHARRSPVIDGPSLRRVLLVPLSLTGATSVIGFSTLAFLANPGHVLLAVVVGSAIVLTYALTLWWVPTVVLPFRASRDSFTNPVRLWTATAQRRMTRFLSIALINVWRRRLVIVLAAGAVFVILAAFVPRLKVEPYPIRQLPRGSAVARAEELMTRELSGTVPFVVEIDAGEAGAFLTAEGLRVLEDVNDVLEQDEEIGYTRSVLDVVTRMHYYFNAANPAYLTIPKDLEGGPFAQLIEQYLLFYSSSVPPEEYESLIDADYRTAAVHGILRYHDGASLGRLEQAVRGARARAPAGWRFDTGGVAAGLIARKRSLEGNWYLSFAMGALLIFVVVSILYRSIPMALVALVPSIAILVGVSGLSALIGMDVDEYTVIVIIVSTGLTIDYTIHPLNAVWRTRAPGKGIDIVGYAYSVAREAGMPVLMSLLTTVLAFSAMLLSAFSGAVHFSLMLSLAVLAAFCGGMLLIPAFFFRRQKEVVL